MNFETLKTEKLAILANVALDNAMDIANRLAAWEALNCRTADSAVVNAVILASLRLDLPDQAYVS